MLNKIKFVLPVILSPYFFYFLILIDAYYVFFINYKKYSDIEFILASFTLMISTFSVIYLGSIFLKAKGLIGNFKESIYTAPIFLLILLAIMAINQMNILGWFLLLAVIPFNYGYLKHISENVDMFTYPIHCTKWKILISYKNQNCYILLNSKNYKCIYTANGVHLNDSFISIDKVNDIEKNIGKPLCQFDEDELVVAEMYNY